MRKQTHTEPKSRKGSTLLLISILKLCLYTCNVCQCADQTNGVIIGHKSNDNKYKPLPKKAWATQSDHKHFYTECFSTTNDVKGNIAMEYFITIRFTLKHYFLIAFSLSMVHFGRIAMRILMKLAVNVCVNCNAYMSMDIH